MKIEREFQFRALQTQNYLLIKFDEAEVYFCKFKIQDCVKDEFQLEFTALPIKDWLDKESFQNGIQVGYANDNTNPRLAGREDLIMIYTLEHMICFDLKRQQQVDYLIHTNQLTAPNQQIVDSG